MGRCWQRWRIKWLSRRSRWSKRYLSWLLAMVLLVCGGMWGRLPPTSAQVLPAEKFAQLSDYPAQQFPDAGYLPLANWSGRLILPDQTAAEADPMDWVWMEIYTSPQSDLVGRRVRLQWQATPENQAFLALVTRGIKFDEAAIASIEQGRIHPTRLNGWGKVGPLQSLAGTRPQDDMIVALPEQGLTVDVANSVVAIDAIPIQIPERFYGLVQVLGPDNTRSAAEDCPASSPCPSNYQRVQHFNPTTQTFDGAVETVRWPQVAPKENGVFPSTPQAIADSPAGESGWYVYGAKQSSGIFEVKAIAPRQLFELTPQKVIAGPIKALNYINFGNWRQTPERQGTVQSVLITPETGADPIKLASQWQVGDRLLVVHLFGGIGGEKAEPRSVPGTVTGHYAFGIGEVVLDPFTQSPRLQIIYNQVYSHNPQGIVSGRTLWAEFTGNLERGWLGTRPISDVLVKIPSLSHVYQFGEITLNPFAEFQRELVVMMARYRTGDGTGAAIVTPAQSCVQDSSQALFETIQVIRQRVDSEPAISDWLATHPDDPQTALFEDLLSLGKYLQRELVPLGIARPDWAENAEVLSGIEAESEPFGNVTNLVNNLLSWRTVIPRVAYDNLAAILLDHGAEMWFLRTNQVGGQDSTIVPLAPTELFGEFVIVPTTFSRLIEALQWPRWLDLFTVALGILAFAIARYVGIQSTPDADHLRLSPDAKPLSPVLAVQAIFVPALLQEVVFRVLLLPHPSEAVRIWTGLIWSATSLGLFVLYCLWRSRHQMALRQSIETRSFYVFQCLCFGVIAMVVYFSAGSLWAATGLHWGIWLWQRLIPRLSHGPLKR